MDISQTFRTSEKKFGFYFWANQIRVFLGHADAINLLEVGVEAVKNSFKHTYDI